jgi:hypothetical protein
MYVYNDLNVVITSIARDIKKTKRTNMHNKLFISASHILCVRCDIVLCDRYALSLLSKQPSILGKKARERQRVPQNVELSATTHGVIFRKRTIFGINTARTLVYFQNCRCRCPCAYSSALVTSKLVIKSPRIQYVGVLKICVIIKVLQLYFRCTLKRAWMWLGVCVNIKRFIF